MLFRQLLDSETSTFTYLLADTDTGEAILIDPVFEKVERDILLLSELGLKLLYTIDTHVHADHITGSGTLRERLGAKTVIGTGAKIDCADISAGHGALLHFGAHTAEIRHTPGHTSSCISIVVSEGDQTMVFTGDALFVRGCGRTDFQQGSPADLYRSVHGQIFTLDDNTLVYPGHDYKGHSVTTVAEEKAHNPRLNLTIDEARFTSIMSGLNLAYPKKIKQSLPANLACGKVPANPTPEA
jgi:glyoxylase-like metal-dependent hydrolase (beta-lactamase superfamily II)